jgi:hypothetical protein
MFFKFLSLSIFATFFLVGCGSTRFTSASVEVSTLQQYMQALVDKNEAAYSGLLCKSWESEGFLEFDAYKGMESQLGDTVCRLLSSENGAAKVNCQGKIQLSYGTEKQEIDLSSRIYLLTSNGNTWQVCGFTKSSQ